MNGELEHQKHIVLGTKRKLIDVMVTLIKLFVFLIAIVSKEKAVLW